MNLYYFHGECQSAESLIEDLFEERTTDWRAVQTRMAHRICPIIFINHIRSPSCIEEAKAAGYTVHEFLCK